MIKIKTQENTLKTNRFLIKQIEMSLYLYKIDFKISKFQQQQKFEFA